MRFFRCGILFVISVILLGCSPRGKLVGNWKGELQDHQPDKLALLYSSLSGEKCRPDATVYLLLFEDGTGELSIYGGDSSDAKSVTIALEWRVKGHKLLLDPQLASLKQWDVESPAGSVHSEDSNGLGGSFQLDHSGLTIYHFNADEGRVWYTKF